MPPTPRKVLERVRLMVDSRLPDRPVRRRVRGVEMTLPRRHGLPYFARPGTLYAENLIDLAVRMSEIEGSIMLLDVGANVGDSTLMVLDRVPGTAVCLEANPRWLSYLETNLGHRPGVEIEPSVLVAPGTDTSVPLGLRTADLGSSIVVREADGEGLPMVTTDELLTRYPQLADVRLIKSDTDGYDISLVSAYLQTFTPSMPVIFFEFDPRPTLVTVPECDPKALWPELDEAGYRTAVVWDNVGNLLFAVPTEELLELSAVLDQSIGERGYGFWDVAVAHDDDPVGQKVLAGIAEALVGR